jgi:hypothetical protein
LEKTNIRDGNGVENLLSMYAGNIYKECCVSTTDAGAGHQYTSRYDKVRGEDELVLPVNTQAMRI